MTMIERTESGPQDATERKRLTKAERNLILERQSNKCDACGAGLIFCHLDDRPIYAPMIDEHILPLDLGGSNDLANRALYCVPCAKEKTRADMKRINKARRIRRTLAGETPPKQRIRSAGFRKDPLR